MSRQAVDSLHDIELSCAKLQRVLVQDDSISYDQYKLLYLKLKETIEFCSEQIGLIQVRDSELQQSVTNKR